MPGWLDTLLDRGREAKAAPAEQKPARAMRRLPAQPAPEIRHVTIHTSHPEPETGWPGSIEVGYYFVTDGVVTMCDQHGKSSNRTQALGPEDDPRIIAGRMLRGEWLNRTPDFNRRLRYPRHPVV